jgi:DNA invertase Pin-like site-specific DNA recombinase
MLVGYARLSTEGQSLEPQIEHLKSAGCETVFSDLGLSVPEVWMGLDDALQSMRSGDRASGSGPNTGAA